MKYQTPRSAASTAVLLLLAAAARAETHSVGPGRRFARIEEAVAAARPGDLVEVHPLEGGRPYEKVAVQARLPGLTIRGVRGEGGQRVVLSGEGFDHSGRGAVPRAIVQFNQGAHGGVLEGFELTGARNGSRNGAGVRIVEADRVTIRDCDIHHNDMGVMSSGDGSLRSARDQRIEGCLIHENGSLKEEGQSHNLYLGGTSVVISGCEVYRSLVGHNVKSRAHHTRVEHSYIHDSANRELDLVDARETVHPESHAVLVGNVIVKARDMKGNKAVIHFGQDGGKDHRGTVFLVHNTIVTPYIGSVVDLSAPGAGAYLVGNIIHDAGSGQKGQVLASARGGAALEAVTATHNWLAAGFAESKGIRMDPAATTLAPRGGSLAFAAPDRHDYRPAAAARAAVGKGLPLEALRLPALPGARESEPVLAWQYHHPAGKEPRKRCDPPCRGAYEVE